MRVRSALMAMVVTVASLASPAAADPRCVIEAPPVAAAVRAEAPPCHRAKRAVERAVVSAISKEYLPTEGGRPRITFDCDGLGPRIREIVLVRGGGHGGSLELWRARRRSDGHYDVRGIRYQGDSMTGPAATPPHRQARGVVALPDLARARAAMSATIREIVPPTPPGMIRIPTFATSSSNFHLLLRLVDDEGRVREASYAGYAGSTGQNTYLGLEDGAAALAPIFTMAPGPAPADEDDRTFFAERFNAAAPHFDDDHWWWVTERYVDLARYLGTSQTTLGLLGRLKVTNPDRSKLATRASAVDALARITGWDARTGGASIEEAAARYLAACKPSK